MSGESCIIRILTDRGLSAAGYTASSLSEAANFEPDDGVYTVGSTRYATKVIAIDDHFDRLEDSAEREGISLHLDRSATRAALRQMILESGFGDVKFRITVPRAGTPITISIERFAGVPLQLYERGVRCISVQGSSRVHSRSKTTDWMHKRQPIASSLPNGVYEALLCGDGGLLLEGMSSNFYAVLESDTHTVRTSGEGVLPGIVQKILFRIESETGARRFHIDTTPVYLNEVPFFSESFLTSSSRGVVPIVEIDGLRIGNGLPGPLTRHLQDLYERWVESHLVEL